MKNKLFIAGCARSGTSALAQLIGSHSQVVMGMERFGHLYSKSNFKASESLFEKKRFINIEEEDTFYNDFEKFHAWDPEILNKLNSGNYLYIGDKRPDLYEVYDEIFSLFPNGKIIFIYRNVFDVSLSWNKRAEANENWPVTKDYKKAVYSWNISLKSTLIALKEHPKNIYCLRYEDIFIKNKDLSPLYLWLGLTMDVKSKEKYQNLLANSVRINKEKEGQVLSKSQRDFCLSSADFNLERELDKNYLL